MPDNSEMVKQLGAVRHTAGLTSWESHPRGAEGKTDKGGFLESMEYVISKGWTIGEKQSAVILRMYKKYVLGESDEHNQERKDTPKEDHSQTSDSSFELGPVAGRRSTEGWRVLIHGTIIGEPTIREHAYIIAMWLKTSLASLEHFFAHKEEAETKSETVDSPVDADF